MVDSRQSEAHADSGSEAEASRVHVVPRVSAGSTELGDLGHALSHDLRAPLRAIEGFSAALAEDYAAQLDGDGQQLLARVRAAAVRMGVLIDGLVELTRVGKRPLAREELDVSAMAASIVAALRSRDPGRSVRVQIAPRLIAHGDRALLRLALEQLLGNAWKFSAYNPDAAIELGALPGSHPALLFVRDNGVGFDPKYAAGLFQPFQRLHASEDFPGIGIGLALVQRVIRQHGGRIWMESAAGQGASVFFCLDASADAAAAGNAPAAT